MSMLYQIAVWFVCLEAMSLSAGVFSYRADRGEITATAHHHRGSASYYAIAGFVFAAASFAFFALDVGAVKAIVSVLIVSPLGGLGLEHVVESIRDVWNRRGSF
jgi:hypothetical protein